MSSRILMATVAAIALAVPAAAQDQKQPLETQQETTPAGKAPAGLHEQGAGAERRLPRVSPPSSRR